MFERRSPGALGRAALAAVAFLVIALTTGTARAGNITVMWDLLPQPNVTAYRVFVGTSSGQYSETFDVPASRNFYIYRTAQNARRYFFAVAAQFDGATIGPRSEEVSAVGTRTVGELPDGARLATEGGAAATRVDSTCAAECYVVTVLARTSDEVSSLAALPSGGLLYGEGGRSIRLLDAAAVTAPALLTSAAGERLVQVVIDPRFDTNGFVFVASTRQGSAGTEQDIVRYRYLAGTLGEPATVVTGLPVPPEGHAPFTVADNGLLFVAVPAMGSRRDPYAGAVLVFDRDGRVPAGETGGSPLLAAGLDAPAAIAAGADGATLWVTGADASGAPAVKAFRRVGGAGMVPDVGLAGTLASLTSGDPIKALVASQPLVVIADRDLVMADVAALPPAAIRVGVDDYGTPVGLAVGPGGETYLAVRSNVAGGGFAVLRVAAGAVTSRR